jgi:LmbE family N-acetylglucosaminyl deacetylase
VTDIGSETDSGLARPSGLPVGDLLHSGPPTIDLPIPASALAIGAHPDDIEFGCGATLARWADAGCRIHHLILTDGSKGSWDESADLAELVTARRAESLAAAAAIDGGRDTTGAGEGRVFFLDQVDGELVDGNEERREVARVIRTVRPDVVLGHDPWRRYRLHPDHRAAGFLTVDAVVSARDPHFLPELNLLPHRPSDLLLFEPDLPNHVENADGYDERKIDALLAHRSQWQSTMGVEETGRSEKRRADATDGPPGLSEFAAKVRRQMAQHGALAGLSFGEAFHLIDDV